MIRSEEFEELQKRNSELGQEVEELNYHNIRLSEENEKLRQIIQEKDEIQVKMGEHLKNVTDTAYALYHKLCAFKSRYYEEQKQKAFLCNSLDGSDRS